MKSNAEKMGLKIGLVALAAALMALAIVIGILFARDQALDDIRNETLSELETRKGEYDDYSIVLRNTSKSEAKHLAEKIGAELRITSDGSFATLTLTDGRTVKDIYEDDAYKKHISSFTIDYQAKISESKLPSMPTVGNLDELGSYFGYLNLSSVWNKTKGSGITVAVIDTGIDTDHPEFAGRISEYSYNATEDKIVKDYVLEDGSYDWSLVEDEQGHGTAVSGALAAASNDSGMAGVAPAVTVVVIKAECNEDGVFERTSDLVFGLYYAVERDVSVVNMSFGYDGLDNPFAAAVDLAYDSDVICVAAAGNNSTASLSWPAADEKVIGVGSLAEDSWELADYSNYGDNVDICAPGKTYTTAVGGEYALKWGTSLSAPLVSGAVALLAATDNYITFDEVYTLLTASSYDLGTPGRDWNYGLGAIDVYALVAESRGTVVYNMMTDELEDEEGIFVVNHTLQEMLEPERLYAIFDGWYYDPHYVEEFNYYEDRFVSDITLYAKWVSEADGIPYTYTELEDGTIEITSYTGRRRYISVPEYIDGKLVTSIGREAFYGENILRGVNLPSGITNIGDYAFAECSNLVEIEIPEGVLSIGEGAFYNNVRLSAIAFAGAPQLTSIGELAFAHCSSLTSIEIPQNVSAVDGSAFYGMLSARRISVSAANRHYASVDGVLFNASKTKLIAYPAAVTASYTVPEGLTEIGAYAFAFSSMGSVSLGGVQVIGESAFECSRLGSVAIPDSVYSLGEGAFYGCDELSSASLGAGLTDVSEYAFANCVSLTEITIPAAIKVIRKAAFANSGISAVNFAEDGALHSIGASAFAATPVEAVSLPLSLTFVYESAFAKCVKLSEVTFAEGGYLLAIGAYAFLDTWSLTAVTLPDTLEELGDYAFIGSGLEGTVEIPASLEYLGKGAFASCVGLESIEVNAENTTYNSINGVVYTEDSSALVAYPAGNTATSYTLPAETKRVAESAVYGTAYLKTLNLNNGLTELAEQAIYANAVLTGIAIPDSVTLISRYALANNPKMTSITFGESSELDRLGYGALAYTGVTSLTIPKNVSTIAQGAFAGSAKLQYVYFASGSKLESISAYTFDGCTDLRQITFYSGSALTSIQAHGFEGLSKLTAVNFGDAPLKNIDNFAFRFCESLTSVTIPEGVSSIGRYAFYACYKLTSVKLPASIEHIGAFAFLGSEELELYFASETLPIYLDEDWDHGIKSYYLGVSSVETDGNITYAILSDGNVAILKYEDMGGWVDEDLNDYSYLGNITVIGSGAFAYSELETVILPETLVTIQKEAFYNSALTYVELPASVEFIGNNAFAETPIEFIIFADDPALKVIEQSAFENTKALTDSVLIPASVTTLGRAVFRGSAVCAVEFEEGTAITEIPEETFANSLIEYFIAPESVVKVCDGAFKGASALTSFEFSNTEDNLWLGANAFYQSGLEAFYIPENLTVIEEFALVDLSALEAFEAADGNPYFTVYEGVLYSLDMKKIVTVPAGMTGSFTLPAEVEKIGYGAFEGSALDAVLFPEEINLLSIGNRAFFGAESITEIEIPQSVVAIDYYAFAYAKKLQKVTFAEGSRLTGIYEGAFYAAGALSDITVPDGAVEISDFAFYGCHGLTSLPVGDSDALKMIGSYAFAYTGISGELTIPESIDELGSYAFLGIKAEKITVPAANARDLTIGIGAFGEANSLTEITLPFIGASYEDADITWFGYIFGAGKYTANTTYVPEALKKVTVNAEITAVPAYAFYELATLEEISLPDSINTVYECAFYKTVAEYELKSEVQLLNADGSPKTSTSGYDGNYDFGKGISGSLKLAKGITTIGSLAFDGCSSLESIVIPEGVTSIGSSAFYGCSSLKSIVIPEGITSIGSLTFRDCSSLESIVIPEGVTSIGSSFSGCSSLKSIVIPEGVTTIDNYAFQNCSSLKSIVIPEGVTSIGSQAFFYCSSLESVVIPSSVTTIGSSAFHNCNSLESVVIPEGVTTIGSSAFGHCSSLESVVIPSSVTTIGSDAFSRCSSLESVVIPEGVTSIGSQAFFYCSSLKSVVIPEGVTSIGFQAFFYCSSLKSVVIPEGVTTIGDSAFYGCSSLESVVIPSSVTTIGEKAFQSCSSLESVVIPEGVTSIGSSAFMHCSLIESVAIPSSVTSIGSYAFYYCSSLESIVIPEGVTTIGDSAFYGCSSLYIVENKSALPIALDNYSEYGNITQYAKLLIDKDGNKIYKNADSGFEYIDTPDGFRFKKENGKYTLLSYLGDQDTITLPLDINGNSYEIYYFNGAKNVIIPEGVTTIGSYAFSSCSSLESIVIPEGVTSIGSSAFANCSSLESVVIPEGVTEIGSSAFSGCSSLESVVIPEGVTSIGSQAFSDCSSLKSIVIPEGVTEIRDVTFHGCSSLESVVIPERVTTIGSYAFANCSSLKSVTIPATLNSIGSAAFSGCNISEFTISEDNASFTHIDGVIYDKAVTKIVTVLDSVTELVIPNTVTDISSAFKGNTNITKVTFEPGSALTSIGSSAFRECSSLESVVIPEGITSIGSQTFRDCSSLESIVIPEGVTSIGSSAFRECSSLESIVIPEGVTSIGSSAFDGCSSLESVVIPEGVTEIGSYAFHNCSSLESVVIPSSVTTIGSLAFYGCSSLESIVIPEGVTSIGSDAFRDCSSLKSIVIPEGVTTIGSSALSGCSSLKSAVIPEGVTTIGSYAFSYCRSLESIEIPSSVTTIGSSAFYNCSKLNITLSEENKSFIYDNGILYDNPVTKIIHINKNISGDVEILSGVTTIDSSAFSGCSSLESVVIPEGVTTIGYQAFYKCSSLESVVIPEGVTSIGFDAFYNCSSLESVVISEGITSIGSSAFSGCSSLKSIVIPEGITSIGSQTFYYCSSLESVVIPGSVTSIGSYAFYDCSSLESIVIPSSVTSIGSRAFEYCSLLYLVENKSDLPITLDNSSEYGNITRYAKLLIDKDGNKIYKNADSGFEYIDTPDGFRFMKENGKYTLISYHGDEDTITLPTDINGNPYEIYKFNGAKTVIIPEGVTEIGSYAFYDCSSLKSVVIPEGVTEIGSYAFYDCSSLESVVIPEGVTEIGSSAFYNCSSLESVVIPEGVTTIGSSAFSNCSSLESIVIPEGVTEIGSSAFRNCSSLKRVGINYGVTSIGSCAFWNCSSLEVIILPSSVTSMGEGAFTGTAYYNAPENWEDGALYIYRHLIKAPAEAKFFAVKDGTYSIATDAFSESKYTLKHLELGGNHSGVLSGFTNLETLVITELPTSHYVYRYFGSSSSSIPATLARVVLRDGVKLSAANSYGKDPFLNMSGITVYVEANEKDVRWDDNFEGWNNGNTVIYGDQWIFAEFYDNLGSIISKEIFSTSQVIRVPYLAVAGDVQYSYVVEGYDLDGDGIVDVIPATSTTDISAKAIVKAVINSYKVTVYDKDGETVIYEALLPYGSEIALPTPDEKRGYDFLGFIGFEDGMTVTGDIEFYTRWSHVGGSHTYLDPVWLDPTCTDEGGYKHECSVCGEWYLTDKVSATGHSYELTVVAPTCEKEGYDLYTCACGESYADNYTDATGHSYGDWSETKAPTCTEDGEEKRVCSCGASETAVKPAHGHDYMVVDKVDPTCHSNGSITFVCKVCEDVFEEILDATEHIYEETARSSSSKWFESKQKKYKYFIRMRRDDKNPGYAFYYKCTGCGDIELTDQRVSTNTASVMNSCEHAEGVWGTLLPSTYLEEGIDVLECSCCGTILDAKGSPVKELSADFKFSGVALNLTEDINLIYTVSIPEGYESPYVVFLFNGVEYTVTDYTVRADGKYTFKFSGINPQCMGDNVCATLYATCEGELVSRCVAEYSVLKYCQLLLSSPAYSSNAKLVTLISDLLTYGANTQTYRNYKTDALVTDLIAAQGITLSPSVYDNTSEKKTLVSGEAVEGLAWRGAGLYLTNAMSVYFTFSAADTDGLAISFTINGREIVYDVSGLTPDANGRYTVHLYNVMAHEFDSEITASFVRDGVKVGQTLTYSVNSYVITADGLITDSTLDALIKSIYNYGKSVEAYRG